MKYKCILFDLDNTLVFNNFEYRSSVLKNILNDLNVEYNDNIVNNFWSGRVNYSDLFKSLNIKEEDFWRLFEKYDSSKGRGDSTIVYDDVINVLNKLKNQDKLIGIITNSFREHAYAEISHLNFNFDIVVISNKRSDNIEFKPHPQGLLIAMENLNVKKYETLFVGDSLSDMIAAKNAAIDSVLLLRNKENIDYNGKVIYSLNELLNL